MGRKQKKEASLLPKKKFYRQRAHANPLALHGFDYPSSPESMNWSSHYPAFFDKDGAPLKGRKVEMVDVGCGFGGLSISLASLFPENLIFGIEIRTQVTQYVADKIRALRLNPKALFSEAPLEEEERKAKRQKVAHPTPEEAAAVPEAEAKVAPAPRVLPEGFSYQNVSVLRGNAMKHIPNFFEKGQLSKIFFLFPDPHFKTRKHKARIISPTLAAEYAYVVRPGGLLYTITDVPDLHIWMTGHLATCPAFKRLTEEEIDLLGLESDEGVVGAIAGPENREKERQVMNAVKGETEEGKKVTRNNGGKEWSVWRRLEDPED